MENQNPLITIKDCESKQFHSNIIIEGCDEDQTNEKSCIYEFTDWIVKNPLLKTK